MRLSADFDKKMYFETDVSVVIPVCNAERYIAQCLDSILRQTLKSIEIICVDDGSSDATADILANYACRDERITVLSQPNCGAGAARNNGMTHAAGKYIIFLDGDDVFEPDMLQSLFDKAEDTRADAVICAADAFSDVTGEKVSSNWEMPADAFKGCDAFHPEDMSDCMFQMIQGWPWDKLFRTAYLRSEGLSYPDLANTNDMVFVFQAMVLAQRVAVVRDVLVHRRVCNSESISNSRETAWECPYIAVRDVIDAFEKHCVMSVYSQSLCVWILDFLLWHLTTLKGEAQKCCYKAMQREWLPALKLDRHSASAYPRSQYIQMKLIGFLPYTIFMWLKKMRNRINRRR